CGDCRSGDGCNVMPLRSRMVRRASPRAFGATPFLRKGVGNAEAQRFSSPFACEGGLRGMAFDLYFCNANAPPDTTAIVSRAMQVRSPASLSMRISHTCVLRPTWIG